MPKNIHQISLTVAAVLLSMLQSNQVKADSANIYAGIAVGSSRISDHNPVAGNFSGNHLAWAVRAGFRPFSFLGAELEYTDLGNVSFANDSAPANTYSHIRGSIAERSYAAFAMGFIPGLSPKLDIYAKAGLSQVHIVERGSSTSGVVHIDLPPGITCPSSSDYCPVIISGYSNSWVSKLTYGGGVQFTVARLLLRADYEFIDTGKGNTSALLAGVGWKF